VSGTHPGAHGPEGHHGFPLFRHILGAGRPWPRHPRVSWCVHVPACPHVSPWSPPASGLQHLLAGPRQLGQLAARIVDAVQRHLTALAGRVAGALVGLPRGQPPPQVCTPVYGVRPRGGAGDVGPGGGGGVTPSGRVMSAGRGQRQGQGVGGWAQGQPLCLEGTAPL